MAKAARDPLLGTVRVALSVGMVIAILITMASLGSIPLALVSRGRIIAEIARRGSVTIAPDFIWVICGICLLIALAAFIGFRFLRELRRIIDTVAEGDPFIPDNAIRLQRMGWLALAIQLIAIPAGVLSGWASYLAHARYVDISFSFSGALLALILFVLARVFRKGSDMREELEGTV